MSLGDSLRVRFLVNSSIEFPSPHRRQKLRVTHKPTHTRSHDIVTLLLPLSLLSVLVDVCASECKTRALVAPRRPGPFGHGINIKGRVNIVNNLRYNGPSGVDDKFVDMRPEGGRGVEKREKERSQRNNRNEGADWPRSEEEDYVEGRREAEGERRDFSSIS